MALTAKKVYAILKRQISDMEAKLNSPVRYRGTVATADLLPLNPDIGDMYNIESKSVYGEAGMNVAWNGVVWDTMGAPIDMSLYIKSSELADWVKQQNKPAYTAEEVGALPADTKIPSKTSELKNDSGFLTKVPDSYLNGTDTTLKESGKAADAKATGDKFTEISADISKKLDKNQGSENSGKIAGINESGDIVPMFPVGVEYNEETNCLEFGSDQGMKLNQGIGLDSTLTKTGFAADAGVTGKEINSLKESISTKITKFYASSQGETNLQDSDNGKIMDMMLYGKSEQKQYSGKNLLNPTLQTTTRNGVTCTANGDGTYTLNGKLSSYTVFILFSGSLSIDNKSKIILMKNDAFADLGIAASYCAFKISSSWDDAINYPAIKEIPSGKIVQSINLVLRLSDRESPVTLTNVLIKPMIVDAEKYPDATYDAFEPYTGGQPSPSPDYPQEIKSVVNPTVKVCGKNLWDNFKTLLSGNVEQKNGTYIATTSTMQIDVMPSSDGNRPLLLKSNNTYTFSLKTTVDISANKYICLIYTNGESKNIKFVNNNFINFVPERDVEKIGFVLYKSVAGDKVYDVQLEMGSTATSFEPYHEQTVTLPYDLYGVKVPSGGNVTIGGQEYVSDYFDVERGKLVRMVRKRVLDGTEDWTLAERGITGNGVFFIPNSTSDNYALCDKARYETLTSHYGTFDTLYGQVRFYAHTDEMTVEEWCNFLSSNNHVVYIIRNAPEETDLTEEEIQSFKLLQAYYPVTNISINSEQLDGYTVFNYPISMANGWNYVKKQLNDNRDYIYDMDIQSAEAYVNSEYAVALTELEV